MKHSITSHWSNISLTENDLKWFPQNSNNSVVSCVQLHENTGDDDKN